MALRLLMQVVVAGTRQGILIKLMAMKIDVF